MEESVDEASEASEYESDSENEEVRMVLNFTNIFLNKIVIFSCEKP